MLVSVAAALLSLLIVLWGGYSLVCILIPLRPFGTRGRAAKSLGVSLLALITVGLAVSLIDPRPTPQIAEEAATQLDPALDASKAAPPATEVVTEPESGSALTETTNLVDNVPAPCGDGGIVPGDIVAVTGDHELHEAASSDAPKIKNEKASLALGEVHYQQIDNSTTVRRLCAQDEWTEIQIVTPDWLTFVKGWVPNSALREIEHSDDGARLYVESDFYWDDDTSKYKPQIVAVVNKIARENSNCSQIDPSSVAKSSSRSKAGEPVFFVTCGSGADVFNIWFRPKDADSGEAFVAKEPLGQSAAVDACEMAAKQAATHPSTVSFSRVWDLAYIPHVSGRARMVSTFTAKNAFDLELKFRIDCLFDGPSLIEINIAESSD